MQILRARTTAVHVGLAFLLMGLGACSETDEFAASDVLANCNVLMLEDVYTDLESYFDQEICVDAFVEVEYEGMHLYYQNQPPTLIYDLRYGIDAPFGLREAIEAGINTGDRIRIRGSLVPFEPCRVRFEADGSVTGAHCMPYSPIQFENPVYEIISQPPPTDTCEAVLVSDLFNQAEALFRHLVCVTGTVHGVNDNPVLEAIDATAVNYPPIGLRTLRAADSHSFEDGTRVTVTGWSYATHWCFTRERDGYPPCDAEQLAPRIVVHEIARLD